MKFTDYVPFFYSICFFLLLNICKTKQKKFLLIITELKQNKIKMFLKYFFFLKR